jgi:hypothetical protein
MSYKGIPNWPPVWTHGYSLVVRSVKGEVGTLKHVMIHPQMPTRCYLVIEYEGERYTGCLLFNERNFCQQIAKLLDFYLGRPIKEIGDLDVSHTL